MDLDISIVVDAVVERADRPAFVLPEKTLHLSDIYEVAFPDGTNVRFRFADVVGSHQRTGETARVDVP